MWKKRLEACCTLAKLANELAEQKMAVCSHTVREKTLMIIDSETPHEREEDRKDPVKTMELLEQHFLREVNETY